MYMQAQPMMVAQPQPMMMMASSQWWWPLSPWWWCNSLRCSNLNKTLLSIKSVTRATAQDARTATCMRLKNLLLRHALCAAASGLNSYAIAPGEPRESAPTASGRSPFESVQLTMNNPKRWFILYSGEKGNPHLYIARYKLSIILSSY